jgi:hypothetical protein
MHRIRLLAFVVWGLVQHAKNPLKINNLRAKNSFFKVFSGIDIA